MFERLPEACQACFMQRGSCEILDPTSRLGNRVGEPGRCVFASCEDGEAIAKQVRALATKLVEWQLEIEGEMCLPFGTPHKPTVSARIFDGLTVDVSGCFEKGLTEKDFLPRYEKSRRVVLKNWTRNQQSPYPVRYVGLTSGKVYATYKGKPTFTGLVITF